MQVIYVFMGLLVVSALIHLVGATARKPEQLSSVRIWSTLAFLVLIGVGGFWSLKFFQYKSQMASQGWERFNGNPFSENW